MTGAAFSEGGRSLICLPSQARGRGRADLADRARVPARHLRHDAAPSGGRRDHRVRRRGARGQDQRRAPRGADRDRAPGRARGARRRRADRSAEALVDPSRARALGDPGRLRGWEPHDVDAVNLDRVAAARGNRGRRADVDGTPRARGNAGPARGARASARRVHAAIEEGSSSSRGGASRSIIEPRAFKLDSRASEKEHYVKSPARRVISSCAAFGEMLAGHKDARDGESVVLRAHTSPSRGSITGIGSARRPDSVAPSRIVGGRRLVVVPALVGLRRPK